MTDLDDAFNTSVPLLGPTDVTVDWEELPEGMSVGGVDSLRDFGQQLGEGGYKISQSMDDGLPDPVTMTGSNDASGSMGMDLIGREANTADILTGWRATTANGSGTGTSITVTLPSGLAGQDYVVVAITANNQSGVYEATYEVGDPHGWVLLAEVTDSTLTTYVFGRSHWLASPAPDFRINTSGSWSWVSGAVGAHYTAGNSSVVPVKPGTVTTAIESVTQTTHTGPYASLPSRGYMLGVFSTANASGPWTAVSGGTELVESTGGTAALQMIKADLITVDGDYQFVSSTAGSTGVGMMVAIPLVIMDRPAMDAMAFFSPFDVRSPIRQFERDTARVGASMNIISPAGTVSTPIFEGQMADISLGGRTAEMKAVSRTRILLDKALTLPTVHGNRESCTTDWLATHVMAHGGQYPGIAPSPQTRFWSTMHGSVHSNMAGPNAYAAAIYYEATPNPGLPFGRRPPLEIDGPFVTAMFGQSRDDFVEHLSFGADSRNWPTEVPGMEAENNDICSVANSTCRLTFWVRGDATDILPDALNGVVDDRLFEFTMSQANATGTNYISCRIDSDRRPQIFLESGLILTGGNLPVDGLWHFYGFTWNYDTGVARVRRDNVFWDVSGFTSAAAAMPDTEAANNLAGRYIGMGGYARLPIAEMQLEAGPNLYTEQFARFYPTPTAPSLNATYRPTHQWVEAVAETTPTLGWVTLQQIAESTLMSLRTDEADNVVMVPLEYFGEIAQTTVEPYNVLSTDVNAGELGVVLDPTKTRNYVTVEFQQTSTDSTRTSVLDMTSALVIPVGQHIITFPLELPAAELHGAIGPYFGATWNLTKLTALQVAGTNALPNEHFMSVNINYDGAGAVYTGTGFTARIIAWSSSTVTVRFTNTSGSAKALSNNGQDIPFMRILGYPIRKVDAYQSFRDLSSQFKRRERALTTEADWIQTRDVAVDIAGKIVTVTSRPRPEIAVTVMGDPRRFPGQLAEISDSEGTRAAGTWRIHAIDTEGSGARYLQTLKMFRVGPSGVWDESLWDDAVWGA